MTARPKEKEPTVLARVDVEAKTLRLPAADVLPGDEVAEAYDPAAVAGLRHRVVRVEPRAWHTVKRVEPHALWIGPTEFYVCSPERRRVGAFGGQRERRPRKLDADSPIPYALGPRAGRLAIVASGKKKGRRSSPSTPAPPTSSERRSRTRAVPPAARHRDPSEARQARRWDRGGPRGSRRTALGRARDAQGDSVPARRHGRQPLRARRRGPHVASEGIGARLRRSEGRDHPASGPRRPCARRRRGRAGARRARTGCRARSLTRETGDAPRERSDEERASEGAARRDRQGPGRGRPRRARGYHRVGRARGEARQGHALR